MTNPILKACVTHDVENLSFRLETRENSSVISESNCSTAVFAVCMFDQIDSVLGSYSVGL